MGFLSESGASAAGQQIISWNTAINEHLNSVQTLKSSLNAQLTNMRSNEDFTQEDIVEVEALVNNINTRIQEL